jgi:hypothetical protein
MAQNPAQSKSGGGKRKRSKDTGPKVEVRNANQPGWTGKVDAAKFEAMCSAITRVLPRSAPGLTQTEIRNKVVFHLPDHVFPGGERSDWWTKTVLLDMEADGLLEREKLARPFRWHRI